MDMGEVLRGVAVVRRCDSPQEGVTSNRKVSGWRGMMAMGQI